MRDAVAVGDDQGWPIVGLGLDERLECLLVAGSHRHARHIDAAIGHRQHAQVFLGRTLAARGEFCHRAARRGLRCLPSRIGVDLGIQHQDVDIAPASQHMVEAAKADVIGPAIAADDPDTLLHQRVGDRQKLLLVGAIELVHSQ